LPVIAVALDAKIEIKSKNNRRVVSAQDFFQGVFTVDLEPEELVTSVEFPKWDTRNGYAFIEVARRHGDYALVGVAVVVGLDEAGKCRHSKIVYLNVGEVPMVAIQAAQSLVGEHITDATIEHAAQHASQQEIDPIGNIHASVSYQRHLAAVLTRRALKLATQRAHGGSA
jgi:CO/xanthine dehydrogenase FAD-binding subunit